MKEIAGKYDIVRKLGAGGMGSVFEAIHRTTRRHVAVKVILEEARFEAAVVARFQREARAVGSVDSEHITQVLDGGVDPTSEAPYLVMELLSGEDLDALIRRLGILPCDLALRIAAQMLEGLQLAHEAGVVHRDIKPANVFLAKKSTKELVVKICDFGIAKVKTDPLGSVQDAALTQTSSLIGSPMYMSPEQAKGAKDLDARTDIWSTGVVLYQLLTGVTPHHNADTLGLLLLAICSEPAPPLGVRAPWVTDEVATLVRRALDMNVETRFQSARAMRDAILPLLRGGTTIDEGSIVGLGDDERAVVAAPGAAMASTRADAAAVAVAKTELLIIAKPVIAEPVVAEPVVAEPVVAAAVEPVVPPKRTPRRVMAAIGLVGLAVVGVGLVRVSSAHSERGGDVTSASSGVGASASVAAAPSVTASASAAVSPSVVASTNANTNINTNTNTNASASADAGTSIAGARSALAVPRTAPRVSAAVAAPVASVSAALAPAPAGSPTIYRDFH